MHYRHSTRIQPTPRRSYTGWRHPQLSLLVTAFVLMAAATTCLSAPQVTRSNHHVTVRSDALTVVISEDHGGTITQLQRSDGRVLSRNHALYTDRGIYGDGVYYGTTAVDADVEVSTIGETVRVRSEGTLRSRDGELPDQPGHIDYRIDHVIGDGPNIHVRWSATPDFSAEVSGFFAYILSVQEVAGIFANTADGVLLQDAADVSDRTYQSSRIPLHPEDPWLGAMYTDGSIISFHDLNSTMPFSNVFFHESGDGIAALFFAWIDGGRQRQLKAGQPIRAQFTMSLHDTFETFRTAHHNARH